MQPTGATSGAALSRKSARRSAAWMPHWRRRRRRSHREGQPTNDLGTLLGYELQQASGTLPGITLANTTDLAPAGAGLDMSLARTYSASLVDRDNPGAFGDGWTFTYNVSAVTDESGNVYLVSPSSTETFTLESDGTYVAQPGDASTLTLKNGVFTLTSTGGTAETFLSDRKLASITRFEREHGHRRLRRGRCHQRCHKLERPVAYLHSQRGRADH